MKDWRDCGQITYKYVPATLDGKVYQMQKWNFEPCYKCQTKECRGKILVRASGRAIRAISKI